MILVVGGAGYIGSHVVKELIQTEQVIVYDNLSTGHREAVDEHAIFVQGDLMDEERLTQLFSLFPIDAVLHFAAASLVGESVRNPGHYYENNVGATLNLLKVMRAHGVKKFIFSSTAATYQPKEHGLLDEESATCPANPYGRSKRMVEQILEDYTTAYDFQIAAVTEGQEALGRTIVKLRNKGRIYAGLGLSANIIQSFCFFAKIHMTISF